MHPFDRAVLTFNPASTGNASGLAAELRDELARRQPDLPVMLQQTVTRIDSLRLTVDGSSPTTRYAHSHIGLGLTPVVAVDLEKGGKGSLKETLTAMRAFAHFRPFEKVITAKHTAKWRRLGTAMKAGVRGLGPQPSVRQYHFTNLKKMPIQVDGEVMELDAGATVRIDMAHRMMQTLL